MHVAMIVVWHAFLAKVHGIAPICLIVSRTFLDFHAHSVFLVSLDKLSKSYTSSEKNEYSNTMLEKKLIFVRPPPVAASWITQYVQFRRHHLAITTRVRRKCMAIRFKEMYGGLKLNFKMCYERMHSHIMKSKRALVAVCRASQQRFAYQRFHQRQTGVPLEGLRWPRPATCRVLGRRLIPH
jgi:hypothetical protein